VNVRTPEGCPHRRVANAGAQAERASCEILRSLLDGADRELTRVGRDACEACCRSFEPTAVDFNSVIASLLFGAATEVIDAGGVAGCSRERAEELRVLAHANLRLEDLRPRVDYDRVLPVLEVSCRCLDAPAREFPANGPADEVTPPLDRCAWCRDWSPAVRCELPAVREQLAGARARRGPRVTSWAVGVITSPRRLPTLADCLDSVMRAGWPRPHVFVDGDVAIEPRHRHLPITVRRPGTGPWPNYWLSLSELLMRAPHADAYLLLEDDALVYDREDLRAYLEEILWPDEATGFVSLYSSMAYTAEEDGWFELTEPWIWGALAFVFPRAAALDFVGHADVLAHRATDEGLLHADVLAGGWAAACGRKVFHPLPSLVQHIGETSTVWTKSAARGERRAARFAGDPFFRALRATMRP